MKFSQRIGITHSSKTIQLDSVDEELKNGLWNIYKTFFSTPLNDILYTRSYELNEAELYYINSLWHSFFKLPIDSAPNSPDNLREYLRRWYFANAKWYEIYDFLEFSINLFSKNEYSLDLGEIEDYFNNVLEREFAGYRFINGHIAPITNSHEINELNEAIEYTDTFTALSGCNTHLISALSKISVKINPDYRNSIKESISAVESLAKVLSGKTSDTLNSAIDRIKGKLKIHRSLEHGLKNLYNYTSDADGIRHGLMDDSNCDFEDAKFMLISCSAFINYLIAKANKAGIELS